MKKQDTEVSAHCAACPVRRFKDRRCMNEGGKNPPDCPTALQPKRTETVQSRYHPKETLHLARVASMIECAGYERLDEGDVKPTRPRIVELVDFSERMRFKRLGLIFCMGLREEAAITQEILETNGFTVVSAVCKVGCVPKSEIGLGPEDQLNPNAPETMCNPILQAEIANEAEVDFNILLGLCIGHDTLVLQHLKAPATILAVKDRLMGHNPLAPLHAYNTYYSWLKKPLFPKA